MGSTDFVRVVDDENLTNNVSPNVTLVIIIDIIYILSTCNNNNMLVCRIVE